MNIIPQEDSTLPTTSPGDMMKRIFFPPKSPASSSHPIGEVSFNNPTTAAVSSSPEASSSARSTTNNTRQQQHVSVDETRQPNDVGDHSSTSSAFSFLRTSNNNNSTNEELQCDHKNATVLYKLLEETKWDDAILRIRTHPIEAQTWIVRRDKKRHEKVLWRLLPLHAAIVFQSPPSVIVSLLEIYPLAASMKDDQGMIPLHLAFRLPKKNESILQLLLVQYPDGVDVKDKKN